MHPGPAGRNVRMITSNNCNCVARPGRHLLIATRKGDGALQLPGGAVDTVYRITTTSFVVS